MTHDKELFKKLNFTEIRKVRIVNGMHLAVKEKGTIAISSYSGTKLIHDVLFVPKLDQNLLSVGQLIEKGFKLSFEDKHCLIKNGANKEMFKVKMKGRSFSLNPMEEEQVANPVVAMVTEIWHKCLGHYHYNGLLQIHRLNMVKNLPDLQEHSQNCQVCQYGKLTRKLFPKVAWRASRKLQLIHTDRHIRA